MAARRPPAILGTPTPGSLLPQCRNVTIRGFRTSIRMEPVLWDGLTDICQRESVPLADLVSDIDGRRGASGLTAALRVFILAYYRRAVVASNRPAYGFSEDDEGPGLLEKAMSIFDLDPDY
jgi:predicted DNA-binding ribbon-helix-helix protein